MRHSLPLVSFLLSLGLAASARAAEKTVQLALSKPQLDATTTFEFRFSEPMVDGQAIGAAAGQPPVKIAPAVKGTFTWLSPRSVVFTPEEALPLGTALTFTLREGLANAGGTAVEGVLDATVETPPFHVKGSASPRYFNPENAPADPALNVLFNADVRAEDAARFFKFVDRTGREVAARVCQADSLHHPEHYFHRSRSDDRSALTWTAQFAAQSEDGARDNQLFITSEQPLPAGEGWQLVAIAGLPSADGQYRLGADFAAPVGTVLPFQLSNSYAVNHGLGDRRFVLRFSKPLADDAARFLHVRPEPEKLKATVEGDTITLAGAFEIGTAYTVVADAGLHAKESVPLERATEQTRRFFPVDPDLSFAGFADQQLSTGQRKYVLFAINVPRIRVTAKLLDAATLPQALAAYDQYLMPPRAKHGEEHRKIDSAKISGREIFTRDFDGTEQVDVNRKIALDWDEILGPGRTGVVLVTAEQLGEPATPGKRPGVQSIVQVTDLGAVWKRSRKDTFVHAFSLAAGTALDGVRLTLLDAEHKVLGDAATDAAGLATLPPATAARWLLAQRGADMNLIPLDDGEGVLSLWRFRIPRHRFESDEESDGDGRQMFLFTERAVYRPGEVVHFKGIVRDAREGHARIPADTKLEILAFDSRGREFFRKTVALSAIGSMNEDIQLPAGVLGEHRLLVKMSGEGGNAPEAEHSFQVQEYVPNAFEISVGGPKNFTGAQRVEIPVSAKYYMGKPLSRAQLTWSIEADDADFVPAGFDDFAFCEAIEDSRLERELDRLSHFTDQGKLDLGADGSAGLQFQMPLNVKAPQPREGRLLCEITDLNQQTVSQSENVTLHASDFYLGIGKLPAVLHAGDKMQVALVAVRNDGVPETNAVNARVRITRVDWENTRVETAGYASAFHSEPRYTLIAETPVRTQPPIERERKWTVPEEKRESLVAGAPGLYLLEATARDAAGRDVLTATTFYVTGEAVAEWDYRNQFQIDLVSDKLAYDSGETAHILVKTPIEGEALVTVERENVLRSFVVKLAGNAPGIDVPLLDSDAPNVFVSVTLLRGADDSPRKFKTPEFRVGYCQLSVARAASKLAVRVAPESSKYQPGEPVTLVAEVLDFHGKPRADAEVTLYAVDEGVLSLTGYETPNPFEFFHKPLPLGVTTALTIPSLLAEDPEQRDFTNKGYLVGGGGEESGNRMRNNFVATAYWNATLRTDATGRVTARFPAPDGLTRYRVIAVAHTARDEFGSAQSAFEISKPVMLEPALPRFANIGDRLTLRGVLHNQTDFAGEVEVRVELGEETVTRRATLPAHGTTAVDFPVEFKAAGETKWKWTARFLADDGRTAFRDAVQTTLKVGYPVPLLREVHVGHTDAAESEPLASANPALLDAAGVVRVSVANTRMIELGETVRQLLHYPYGCVEQTTSSTLPWLVLRDFRDALPELKKSDGEIRAAVNHGIDRLLTMQTDSGGLSYWPGEREPMLWGSAYGGLGMALARRAGFDVPGEAFDALCKYVSAQLRGLGDARSKYDHYGLNERCLALYMLALAGRAEPAYHEKLFAVRDTLTAENRALLALAVLESQGQPAMAGELLSPQAAAREHDDGMFWCASRAQALRLLALTKQNPDTPQIDVLVSELFGGRASGHWPTTQGNAWSLLALAEYFKRAGDGAPISGTIAWAGKTSAFQLEKNAPLHLAGFPFDAGAGAQPMRIVNPEKRRVFTEIEIESRPRLVQQPRQDRGYAIERRYAKIDDDGALSELKDAKIGDRVLVTLQLTARMAARFVAVEDPLPSVFEAVNPVFKSQQMRPGAAMARDWVSDYQELREDRALFFCNQLFPGTYTLRYLARVRAAGTATAPSAKVEEMYHPERFGLTESQLVSAGALK